MGGGANERQMMQHYLEFKSKYLFYNKLKTMVFSHPIFYPC